MQCGSWWDASRTRPRAGPAAAGASASTAHRSTVPRAGPSRAPGRPPARPACSPAASRRRSGRTGQPRRGRCVGDGARRATGDAAWSPVDGVRWGRRALPVAAAAAARAGAGRHAIRTRASRSTSAAAAAGAEAAAASAAQPGARRRWRRLVRRLPVRVLARRDRLDARRWRRAAAEATAGPAGPAGRAARAPAGASGWLPSGRRGLLRRGRRQRRRPAARAAWAVRAAAASAARAPASSRRAAAPASRPCPGTTLSAAGGGLGGLRPGGPRAATGPSAHAAADAQRARHVGRGLRRRRRRRRPGPLRRRAARHRRQRRRLPRLRAKLADADGDGIPDGSDACPAAARGANDANEDGCPDGGVPAPAPGGGGGGPTPNPGTSAGGRPAGRRRHGPAGRADRQPPLRLGRGMDPPQHALRGIRGLRRRGRDHGAADVPRPRLPGQALPQDIPARGAPSRSDAAPAALKARGGHGARAVVDGAGRSRARSSDS